jgi:hypothetical protein
MRLCPMTTRRLMMVVAMFAVGIAFLRHVLILCVANELVAIAVIAFFASSLLFMRQRGRRRGFWLGFALFGWGYLALSQADWNAQPINEHLPTTWLFDDLFGRLYPAPLLRADDFGASVLERERKAERFRLAGHSLVSLLFAIMGGIGCYHVFRSRDPGHAEPDPPDGSLLRTRSNCDVSAPKL